MIFGPQLHARTLIPGAPHCQSPARINHSTVKLDWKLILGPLVRFPKAPQGWLLAPNSCLHHNSKSPAPPKPGKGKQSMVKLDWKSILEPLVRHPKCPPKLTIWPQIAVDAIIPGGPQCQQIPLSLVWPLQKFTWRSIGPQMKLVSFGNLFGGWWYVHQGPFWGPSRGHWGRWWLVPTP